MNAVLADSSREQLHLYARLRFGAHAYTPCPRTTTTGASATDLSDTFVDTGAGDGVADTHWAILQLLDASSKVVTTLETNHALSTI